MDNQDKLKMVRPKYSSGELRRLGRVKGLQRIGSQSLLLPSGFSCEVQVNLRASVVLKRNTS